MIVGVADVFFLGGGRKMFLFLAQAKKHVQKVCQKDPFFLKLALCFGFRLFLRDLLLIAASFIEGIYKVGPLPVSSTVITPINGLING